MFANKDEICRTCFVKTGDLSPLFKTNIDGSHVGPKSSLAEFVSSLIDLQLDKSERYPDKICKVCEERLLRACSYLNQVRQNETFLKSKIRNEEESHSNSGSNDVLFGMMNSFVSKGNECSDIKSSDKADEINIKEEKDATAIETDVKSEEDAYEPNESVEEDNGESFSCSKCNKSFKTKQGYIRHMKSFGHKNINVHAFECSTCSKVFTKKRNLVIHARVHNVSKYKLCPYCGKSIAYSSHFTAHIRRHTGERPYKCEVCAKRFTRRPDLTAHLKIHTGERPFVCNICNKGFIKRNKLDRHMLTHTGDRPFKCTFCERAFSQSNELTLHIRRHTGEKPYVCAVCKKGFIDRSSLKAHCRKRDHTEDPIVRKIGMPVTETMYSN